MTRIMEALQARMDRIRKGDKGFTLIELLVVVIIIGILAAIAIPVYIGVQNNAKDSAVKSDLGNAKTAVVAYYTQVGSYPTTLTQAAGTNTPSMASLGYTQSSASNYDGTITSLQFSTGTANAFCIYGKSSPGNFFAVSDTTPTTDKKKCDANGVMINQ